MDQRRTRPPGRPRPHDATRDIRTPTHELTIGHDALRTRRRIAGQTPDWALSTDGIQSLRQAWPGPSLGGGGEVEGEVDVEPADPVREREGDDAGGDENLPGVDYVPIDALLAL